MKMIKKTALKNKKKMRLIPLFFSSHNVLKRKINID